MTTIYKNPVEKLEDAILQLSDYESHKLVYTPYHGKPMPSTTVLSEIVETLREILFPGYFGNSKLRPDTIHYHIGVKTDRVFQLLAEQIRRGICFACEHTNTNSCLQCEDNAPDLAAEFISKLPALRKTLSADVRATYNGDPAAKGFGEIIYCYPNIRVLINHRVAHELLKLEVPLIPRIIAEMAHSETGIDIHPGAQIGEAFTIDHGTGVVIGETCIIGNNVKIYQGVTLGAKSFPLDAQGNPIKGIPRHPIVEDNVVIYAQATILGRITVGANSIIGGNVWVTNNLPANSRVVQMKARSTLFVDGAGI